MTVNYSHTQRGDVLIAILGFGAAIGAEDLRR
jgi:hypothetical protein